MRKFDQQQIDQVLKKRFFLAQSAHIYGGISGLYDLGPPGLSIKTNILALWRKHFVLEEDMLEIETTTMLPYDVLKASGHVDKFCDILVFDEVTGDCFRADHLVEETLEKMSPTEEVIRDLQRVDCMTCQEIDAVISKYNIKSVLGNKLSKSQQFNLMFGTQIGYKGGQTMFLRPETAQGQFLNFKKLYEYNNEKLPFASASIGKSYRNEISPRSGLIRVREFDQAEIEHFVLPDEKKHPKFSSVKEIKLKFIQEDSSEEISLGEAVERKMVCNETIGYYIGRTALFLIEVGIDKELLRFRQHKKEEMAHYAKDCWDAEIYTSYGWIECVGIADRSCYDLKCHEDGSKVDLRCKRRLTNPKEVEEWILKLDKKEWGARLRDRFSTLIEMINGFSQEYIEKNISALDGNKNYLNVEFDGHGINVECSKEKKKIFVENVIPDVIEPSFGIGRILYALLEHSFYQREDLRPVLKLKPMIAPIQCAIGYLIYYNEFEEHILKIKRSLAENGLVVHVNERSCSIGRKYSSYDELGVPFFITFDPDFLKDSMVTIRERDTMNQIRVDVEKCPSIILEYIRGESKWN
ncbi:glycyl-tRNA synthetase [Encephalitozoon intestinalis ATCC 50506]|uniref:glycine--tRNA ligase n=1 Tax=Encephalitozoon intestinalis (strain ATCC 50506) TaxID=876142 RepID=E0S9W6_ENCIT|nr:glycyl-tRNA synthetase [Encephalitozoon intestinalis ATCC 50506]ADM12501.1 glycyl-tRNA synthetase [Encephalitozoon intestinalis ATCC 50506]UTX46338.1 glycyl-tRNA synthetase [Encephalitozoon intestinalis]